MLRRHDAVDPSVLRSLLRAYFKTVTSSLAHTVPKAIMHFLVKASCNDMSVMLFKQVARPPFSSLLLEAPNVATRRKSLVDQQQKLAAASTALEKMDTL